MTANWQTGAVPETKYGMENKTCEYFDGCMTIYTGGTSESDI